MLSFVEVHKLDPDFSWIEIKAADDFNLKPTLIRLTIGEPKEMAVTFGKRYIAKQEQPVTLPDAQFQLIEELFEDTHMAKIMIEKGTHQPDLIDLIPTTMIHFKYPERTSFRKSRAARIKMFCEEAYEALRRRDFEEAMKRLNWVHLLDHRHEEAFELKVVCLRSAKKLAECVSVLEAWVETHPERVEPRLGLSELWLHLDQTQRALESFQEILNKDPTHNMALIGLAQARSRLGEDPIPQLRRAWVVSSDYTKDMVERHFDFRAKNAKDLVPMTLNEIAKRYKIPLARLVERATRGSLPAHPPESDGLLRFSLAELDRYYETLLVLGLEVRLEAMPPVRRGLGHDAREVQPGLFDQDEDHGA